MLTLRPSLRQRQNERAVIERKLGKKTNALYELGEAYAVHATIIAECFATKNFVQENLARTLIPIQEDLSKEFNNRLKDVKMESPSYALHETNIIERQCNLAIARKEGTLFRGRKFSLNTPALTPFLFLHIASFLDEKNATPFFLLTVTRPSRPSAIEIHQLSHLLTFYHNVEVGCKALLFKNVLQISPLAFFDPNSPAYQVPLQDEVSFHFCGMTVAEIDSCFKKVEATPALHEVMILSGLQVNFRDIIKGALLKAVRDSALVYKKSHDLEDLQRTIDLLRLSSRLIKNCGNQLERTILFLFWELIPSRTKKIFRNPEVTKGMELTDLTVDSEIKFARFETMIYLLIERSDLKREEMAERLNQLFSIAESLPKKALLDLALKGLFTALISFFQTDISLVERLERCLLKKSHLSNSDRILQVPIPDRRPGIKALDWV